MIARFTIILILLFGRPSQEETKVITYSKGKPETTGYEALAFWIKDGKRSYIRYTHGADDEITLAWQGLSQLKDEKACKLAFPESGHPDLFVVLNGTGLKVSEAEGKNLKLFNWEDGHEGDAAETCDICPNNATEASSLLNKYFFK